MRAKTGSVGRVGVARGSVRRQVRIDRSPDDVWALVGNPSRIEQWFPGIVSSAVDGDQRVITTGSGIPLTEQLLTVDPLQRRFQYRITGGLFREHLGTIDVLDLDDGASLVVYSTDAEPAMLALVVGGATGAALEHLRLILEGDHRPEPIRLKKAGET